MSSTRSWAISRGGIALALLAHACTEPPAAPTSRAPLHASTNLTASQTLGPYTLDASPDNVTPTPWRQTGIVIPDGRVARLRVEGTIHFEVNPAFEPCAGHAPEALPHGQDIGPAGFAGAPFPFRVVVGLSDAVTPPAGNVLADYGSPNDPVVSGFVKGLAGVDMVWAERPAAWGFQCGPNPEYKITGGQVISAVVLPQPTVTPDRATAIRGETVTFTLAAPPGETIAVTQDLTWSWVPDVPPANSQFVAGCGVELQCRVRLGESGHVQVDGILYHGFLVSARSPTVAVAAAPLRIQFTADQQRLVPEILGVTFTGQVQGAQVQSCLFPGITGETTPLHITVTRDLTPVVAARVTVTDTFVSGSGGHDHQTSDRVGFGHLALAGGGGGGGTNSFTGTTDANGQLALSYRAGAIGGTERLKAVAADGSGQAEAQLTIDIIYDDLEDLPRSEDYALVGTTSAEGQRHLSNHWGTASTNADLQLVAARMRDETDRKFPGQSLVLRYNDMNIERGGVFDLGRGGTDFAPPHESHSIGVDVDVSRFYARSGATDAIRTINYASLERVVHDLLPNAIIVLEEDHYHVRLLRCPGT